MTSSRSCAHITTRGPPDTSIGQRTCSPDEAILLYDMHVGPLGIIRMALVAGGQSRVSSLERNNTCAGTMKFDSDPQSAPTPICRSSIEIREHRACRECLARVRPVQKGQRSRLHQWALAVVVGVAEVNGVVDAVPGVSLS